MVERNEAMGNELEKIARKAAPRQRLKHKFGLFSINKYDGTAIL